MWSHKLSTSSRGQSPCYCPSLVCTGRFSTNEAYFFFFLDFWIFFGFFWIFLDFLGVCLVFKFLTSLPSVWYRKDLILWRCSRLMSLTNTRWKILDHGLRHLSFYFWRPGAGSVSTAWNALTHITLVSRPFGHGVFQAVVGDAGEGH